MARQCAFCGKPYTPRRMDQSYCSSECSKKGDTLELKRARALYRALYQWGRRVDRGPAINFVYREVRSWIEEDKALGRPPAPLHAFDLDRGHQRRPMGDTRRPLSKLAQGAALK